MSMAYAVTPGPASTEKEPYVLVLMKGAFERVFDRCTSILADENKTRKIDSGDNEAIQIHYERLASDGLRVLTMCSKRLPASDAATIKELARDDLETGMSFLGLAGIYDPPRVESALAVEDCHKASIIPRMLTGDHVGTAIAIAQQVGILQKVCLIVCAYWQQSKLTRLLWNAIAGLCKELGHDRPAIRCLERR